MKLKLGGTERKSKVIKGTVALFKDETFGFAARSAACAAHTSPGVYDHDGLSFNDSLGEARLSLASFGRTATEHTLQLEGKKATGEVTIGLEWVADPPTASETAVAERAAAAEAAAARAEDERLRLKARESRDAALDALGDDDGLDELRAACLVDSNPRRTKRGGAVVLFPHVPSPSRSDVMERQLRAASAPRCGRSRTGRRRRARASAARATRRARVGSARARLGDAAVDPARRKAQEELGRTLVDKGVGQRALGPAEHGAIDARERVLAVAHAAPPVEPRARRVQPPQGRRLAHLPAAPRRTARRAPPRVGRRRAGGRALARRRGVARRQASSAAARCGLCPRRSSTTARTTCSRCSSTSTRCAPGANPFLLRWFGRDARGGRRRRARRAAAPAVARRRAGLAGADDAGRAGGRDARRPPRGCRGAAAATAMWRSDEAREAAEEAEADFCAPLEPDAHRACAPDEVRAMEAAEKALLREALVYDFEVSDEMAGASPELGQEMELLLYGRLGHYSRSVERLRARAEKQRRAPRRRLLQRLSRGQRGRALVERSARRSSRSPPTSAPPPRSSRRSRATSSAASRGVRSARASSRARWRSTSSSRRRSARPSARRTSPPLIPPLDGGRGERGGAGGDRRGAPAADAHGGGQGAEARARAAGAAPLPKLDHRRTRRQELIATSGSSKLLVESSRGTF